MGLRKPAILTGKPLICVSTANSDDAVLETDLAQTRLSKHLTSLACHLLKSMRLEKPSVTIGLPRP